MLRPSAIRATPQRKGIPETYFAPKLFQGHTRFATSSVSDLPGAHPHQWSPPATKSRPPSTHAALSHVTKQHLTWHGRSPPVAQWKPPRPHASAHARIEAVDCFGAVVIRQVAPRHTYEEQVTARVPQQTSQQTSVR